MHMLVPLLLTGVKYTHISKRGLTIYSQCSKVSWSLDLLLSLCSINWEQSLCKTSLGNMGSEVFTVHKAKIQIWTTAVWIGVLDFFVLNYSDLLSLTNTWNSEIPAQLMTGMWKLPGRHTWVKWPIYRALGFAGGRAVLCLPLSPCPPHVSIRIISCIYIHAYAQIWIYVHHPTSWPNVLVAGGEVPPFFQVQVFLWVPGKR